MRLYTILALTTALAACSGGAGVREAENVDMSNRVPLPAGPNGRTGNTLCLNAAGPGMPDTYKRIESVLGPGAIEAPSDSVYTPPRPHVVELASDGIVGPYFGILAIEPTDLNQDMVPAGRGGDRSRTEIKIAPDAGPQDPFKAVEGDTYVYSWRFRIARNMRFSSSFTHIHQIKAHGGTFSDPPLITFTPLLNGYMDVRFVGNNATSSSGYSSLGSVSVGKLIGQWVDVREEVTYSNTKGRYKLSIRNQAGTNLLDIDKSGLQTWRTGADHMRPKWGIYRKHDGALNRSDDYVYFANFAISNSATPDSNCR
ncbi:MAG: Fibronectin type domain protein [Rhodocyclales bacterium]|nr:Fibronectin type domain protein [Rhodocyclales bacterium]